MIHQENFSTLSGHMQDGEEIHMTNGDILTLKAVLRGWQLFRIDGRPYCEPTANSAEISRVVLGYGGGV